MPTSRNRRRCEISCEQHAYLTLISRDRDKPLSVCLADAVGLYIRAYRCDALPLAWHDVLEREGRRHYDRA